MACAAEAGMLLVRHALMWSRVLAATGLYYIAELVEECSQLAKRIITYAVEVRVLTLQACAGR